MARRRRSLGYPVASCNIRILVGFGKGAPLRRSPLRRAIDPQQATRAVNEILSTQFTSYTVTPTRGVYRLEGEPALAIDVYRTQYDRGKDACRILFQRARCAASAIQDALRQHSVLVVATDPSNQRAPVIADLITKAGVKRCPAPRSARRRAYAAAKGAH